MMSQRLSALFRVSSAEWLGLCLDSGIQDVCSIRSALAFECKQKKGQSPRLDLQEALDREMAVINQIPDVGFALRGDNVEKARAAEFKEDLMPSVDVYVAGTGELLMVECKYRAVPETQIVKSVESFTDSVARKFDAAIAFLKSQGAAAIANDRIVLFNAESKDKVISMFKRLQLQDDATALKPYCVMDTEGFWQTYQQTICQQSETQPIKQS